MKKIQIVDLQTQYQHIKEDIDRGIQAVIDSASFIKGPAVASFQENLEKYTGSKHVIPVGNGTDALQIALMALGLKPGDEVITPTFTFIATAEVVALLGLKPIVVDVDWETIERRGITGISKEDIDVAITRLMKKAKFILVSALDKKIAKDLLFEAVDTVDEAIKHCQERLDYYSKLGSIAQVECYTHFINLLNSMWEDPEDDSGR